MSFLATSSLISSSSSWFLLLLASPLRSYCFTDVLRQDRGFPALGVHAGVRPVSLPHRQDAISRKYGFGGQLPGLLGRTAAQCCSRLHGTFINHIPAVLRCPHRNGRGCPLCCLCVPGSTPRWKPGARRFGCIPHEEFLGELTFPSITTSVLTLVQCVVQSLNLSLSPPPLSLSLSLSRTTNLSPVKKSQR